MADSRLFITLNRASEWERGLLYGLRISENSVVPSDEARSTAVLITGSIDSAEHNFCWKSFFIDAALSENMVIRISSYTAETTVANIGGRAAELDSYLADRSISPEEKLKQTQELFTPLISGCLEGPVNRRGRFIWLKLEFLMLEKREMRLDKIKLLFSSESMMDYLPEIYRIEDGENGFLSRFLSIFDSIFFSMDDRIGELSDRLDYRSADGELLQYLAEWVNIEDAAYLSNEELRRRISTAAEEYRAAGTKKGLARWIENEYGVKPNIIEYFSIKKMLYEGKDKETYRRLFGDDPYKFFILLPENVFKNTHAANIFMEKLKKRIPANAEAEVVKLRKSVILENHTYLGVNSVISGYSAAGADTGNRISHDLILGGSNNEQ